MNRSELIEIIRSRGDFPEGSGEGLEVMISQYPWFHSGYTLMLSTLYRNGDLSFDEMLKTYSISVADREVLYYMLNRVQGQHSVRAAEADHPGVQGQHSDIVHIESEDQSSKEAGIKFENEGFESARQETSGDDGDITESSRSREQLQYEIEKRLAEIEENHRRENLLEIDKSHSSGDLTDTDTSHSSGDLTDTDKSHSSGDLTDTDTSHSSGDLADTDKSHSSGDLTDTDTSHGSGDLLVITEDTEPTPFFDSSLLDLDYSYGTYVLSESGKKKEDTGSGSESRVMDQEISEEDDSESGLIDRFLEKRPRINPDREAGDILNQDLSEKQGEPPDLISETLARIYLGQKYYSKAIHIYEKLFLKYPEKSSYFATQIEKIKELMS